MREPNPKPSSQLPAETGGYGRAGLFVGPPIRQGPPGPPIHQGPPGPKERPHHGGGRRFRFLGPPRRA